MRVKLLAEHEGELPCLVSLVGQAPPGDVVALMADQDRAEIDTWLSDQGATQNSASVLRTKVERAQPL